MKACVRILPAQLPRGSQDDYHLAYEFYSSRSLPALDGSKTIKSAFLSQPALRLLNRFLYSGKGWITISYIIGFVCGALVLFVDAGHGAWLGVLSFFMELPAVAAAYLVLRYDVVALITTTFEFWYVMTVNALCAGVMAASFRDLRVFMVLSSALGYGIPFFMDAVNRAPTVTIIASLMGALIDVVYIVLVAFNMLDDVKHVTVLRRGGFVLAADDVVVNGLGTVVILLSRNAYRKYQFLKLQRKINKLVGSCIMYRCCLALRPLQILPPLSEVAKHTHPIESSSTPLLMQLEFVGSGKTFDAHSVVWPQWLGKMSADLWPRCLRWTLGGVGILGLSTSFFATIYSQELDTSLLIVWFQNVALGCSVVFCGLYCAHWQRALLVELCWSFDYVFMTWQFGVGHVCGCIRFNWDRRCCVVIASWLWAQWFISLDALTPVMKRKLGFHPRFAVLALAVQLVEILCTIAGLVFSSSLDSAERVLFAVNFAGHRVEVRLLSLLFWRVVTCLIWSSRLLWRFWSRKADELIVLQGQVRYTDHEVVRRKWRVATKTVLSTRTSPRHPTLRKMTVLPQM